jgi:hypothetical protein
MNAFLVTILASPPLFISSLCMGQVLSTSIPIPPYLSSLRVGQVPPNLTPNPFFDFSLVHEHLAGMAIPSMKL